MILQFENVVCVLSALSLHGPEMIYQLKTSKILNYYWTLYIQAHASLYKQTVFTSFKGATIRDFIQSLKSVFNV